jgi:hypothetical protein
MQSAVSNFVNNTPSKAYPNGFLGTYFGGLGWDQYFFPNTLHDAGINVPAGFHLFTDSPLSDVASTYNPNFYMLASGGTVYHISPHVAVPGTTTAGGFTLTGLDPNVVKQLAPGMLVKDSSAGASPIPQSTTIASINPDGTSITLNMPMGATFSATRNYDFDGSQFNLQLKTASGNNSMRLPVGQNQIAALLQGMLVTGTGVPDGTRILSIASDNSSITLSNPISPAPTGQSYTFSGGISDPFASQLTRLWYAWAKYHSNGNNDVPFTSQVNPPALTFAPADQNFAGQFAAEVYDVMTNFAKIPVIDNRLSGSSQLMSNIIGDNVGMIPNISPDERQRLTNEVISLVRGVLDFTNPATI